jgi:hypothetical protein
MSDPWVFLWNFGAQVLKLFCSVRYEDYELYMRLLGEAGAMRVLMILMFTGEKDKGYKENRKRHS